MFYFTRSSIYQGMHDKFYDLVSLDNTSRLSMMHDLSFLERALERVRQMQDGECDAAQI
jgi:hypothetical protein